MEGNWQENPNTDYNYMPQENNNPYYNDMNAPYQQEPYQQNMYNSYYSQQPNYTEQQPSYNDPINNQDIADNPYDEDAFLQKPNEQQELAVNEAVESMAAQQVAKKRKKRRRNKIILISISAIVGLLIITSIISSIISGPTPTSVETQAVETGNITQTLITTGTVQSVITQSLYAPASAPVSNVYIKAGTQVQEGDMLVGFDTTELQRAYDTAQANAKLTSLQADQVYDQSSQSQSTINQYKSAYNAAVAIYNQAANNAAALNTQLEDTTNRYNQAVQQYNTLVAQKAPQAQISAARSTAEQLRANVDELSASLAQAQAEIQASAAEVTAKQQLVEQSQQSTVSSNEQQQLEQQQVPTEVALETAKDALNSAKAGIKAPFSGIVSAINVEVGQGVQQYSVVCIIQTINEVQVEVPLTESDLEKVKAGQSAQIKLSGHDYSGSVVNINRIAGSGATTATASAAAAATATSTSSDITAIVSIDNPDDNIHLNIDAKVTITTDIENNVIKVPLTAVYTDTDGNYCMIMQGETAVKKQVTIGITDTNYAHIVSGLSQGDTVITTSSITDGEKVAKATSSSSSSSSS